MWRPGFSFREKRRATLPGYHRAFCRYSLRHRGTEDAPGMVVGLMPDGKCRGYAFLPESGREADVLDYLDEREGAGYRRVILPLEIDGPEGRFCHDAWTYLPDPNHHTHAPHLKRARIVELIATGRGQSGTAHEYLIALIEEINRMGAPDAELEEILEAVERFQQGGGSP